jgi:AbrB family looped-hinge helix DNA binding protein
VLDIVRRGLHLFAAMGRKVYRHKITKAGQVSIPAEVRARWGTSTVAIDDEGDRIVLRPVSDDPIEALIGIFADDSPFTASEAVRAARDEDIEIEEEKWKRLGWA